MEEKEFVKIIIRKTSEKHGILSLPPLVVKNDTDFKKIDISSIGTKTKKIKICKN